MVQGLRYSPVHEGVHIISAIGTEKFPFYIIKYPNAQNNPFPRSVFLSGPAAKFEACLAADQARPPFEKPAGRPQIRPASIGGPAFIQGGRA